MHDKLLSSTVKHTCVHAVQQALAESESAERALLNTFMETAWVAALQLDESTSNKDYSEYLLNIYEMLSGPGLGVVRQRTLASRTALGLESVDELMRLAGISDAELRR